MNTSILLVKEKQHGNVLSIKNNHYPDGLHKIQKKLTLVDRLGEKFKEWYHTSASMSYVPSLNIDNVDEGKEGSE
jgi:hypothetical protein